MSTLPILYSSRSLTKKPEKQGGIFSLKPSNKVNSQSLHFSSGKNQQLGKTLGQFTKNNIKGYYFYPQTARATYRKSFSNSIDSNRYSRNKFYETNVEENMRPQGSMVQPDTIKCRVGIQSEQVDSVGSLQKNIYTSLLLFKTVLVNDQNDLDGIRRQLKKIEEKTLEGVCQIQKQFKQSISKTFEYLSQLRRETHMQTKVNRGQTDKLVEDSENSKLITEGLQLKLSYLSKQCKS